MGRYVLRVYDHVGTAKYSVERTENAINEMCENGYTIKAVWAVQNMDSIPDTFVLYESPPNLKENEVQSSKPKANQDV